MSWCYYFFNPYVTVYVKLCPCLCVHMQFYCYLPVSICLHQSLSFLIIKFIISNVLVLLCTFLSKSFTFFFSYFLDAFISMFLFFSAYDHLKMLFYIFFVKKKYQFFLCNNSYFLLLFVLFWKKSYKCKNYFMASVFQFSGCCLSSLLLFFEILYNC